MRSKGSFAPPAARARRSAPVYPRPPTAGRPARPRWPAHRMRIRTSLASRSITARVLANAARSPARRATASTSAASGIVPSMRAQHRHQLAIRRRADLPRGCLKRPQTRRAERVPGQHRLAHPGLAGQHHQRAASRREPVGRFPQDRKLTVATDEQPIITCSAGETSSVVHAVTPLPGRAGDTPATLRA